MPNTTLTLEHAVVALQRGGVIAYPTEAVFGLGCDPCDEAAVRRVLAIKQRPIEKGVILIAANFAQIEPLLRWSDVPQTRREEISASWPGANTWLIPCRDEVPRWLRGDHATLAVRITAHKTAAALCLAFGKPLVSTSANVAGEAPARCVLELDTRLLVQLDGVVAGETDGLANPSVIRDALSGDVMRA